MSSHPPNHRSQLSATAHSTATQPTAGRTIPETRANSYSSLDQALVPPAQSRDSADLLYHQRPPDPPAIMASDSRYIYYAPQEVSAPPGYPQYPPYDAQQYQANPARPIRNGVPPPTHPAPQQQPGYPPPPNGYPHPSAYVSSPYGGPPPHPHPPPQWTPEAWQHFHPQSFVQQPNPPAQDSQQYATNNGRQEISPQSAPESRAPADNAPNPVSTQPTEEQAQPSPPAPADAISQPTTRAARDAENQGPPSQPPTHPLDFSKLLDTYRLILDSANVIASDTGQGRFAVNAEGLERMLQAASFGAQTIDSATKRVREGPPVPPSTDEPAPEEGDGSGGKSRQKTDAHPPESGQTCLGCNATSTPEWRRGPMGPRTLCNACGLVYAKLIKKRTREPGRSRSGTNSKQGGHAGHPDSGDDGSDRASQGRGSEVPDERQG